ncbi:RdgB/HAM1 family non-canonical purine NTP pyrophosphatase [Alloscardovia theropitheci]|uniref:dITP/XTP pyrophosphatase n=1 Tax=Alloscardovia theropitheci TaxID=2496842 RepID=A0A4R0QUZ0_9BIFI|nr:RdgB/HAM1 family non-canonical purine NTP pyrophosphatase [Alloscardovia theropitheci]TCD53907.1 RdgB/HAM1 family non-canonical purine NTP pyrophosphatase [Alloscardovia theropitheci]
MSQRVVVATHNAGKVREIARIIGEVVGADDFEFVTSSELNLPDPVEDGTTFQENALLKARDAAFRTGLPAMADDSGLIVDVMGMAPGILSARWAGKHGDDQANNSLLLAQLSDIPDKARGARFRCAAALVIPAGLIGGNDDFEVVEIRDMEGVILREPRGTNGFGYDPLFVPNDQEGTLTSAEMSAQEKNAISHRGKALRALAPYFEKIAN